MVFDVATVVGSVVVDAAAESGCVEFDVPIDIGLVAEFDGGPGGSLPMESTDMVDIGRVGLVNFFVGLGSSGSLNFDLPNPKSLLKNPRFLGFCYTNDRLRIAVTTREIFTGGGYIGLLFNNDEGTGVCLGRKPGTSALSAEVEAIDI